MEPQHPSADFDVFISYRREGGDAHALWIREKLVQRGLRVFLDVVDLRKGYFDEKLLHYIAETPNFLVILSPNALDRCVNEEDWLRLEIAQAVRSGRNIIPVILHGFQFPAKLSDDIRSLPRHQGVEYSHIYHVAMIDSILRSIEADRQERELAAVVNPVLPPPVKPVETETLKSVAPILPPALNPTPAVMISPVQPAQTFLETQQVAPPAPVVPSYSVPQPLAHSTKAAAPLNGVARFRELIGVKGPGLNVHRAGAFVGARIVASLLTQSVSMAALMHLSSSALITTSVLQAGMVSTITVVCFFLLRKTAVAVAVASVLCALLALAMGLLTSLTGFATGYALGRDPAAFSFRQLFIVAAGMLLVMLALHLIRPLALALMLATFFISLMASVLSMFFYVGSFEFTPALFLGSFSYSVAFTLAYLLFTRFRSIPDNT